jgi:hypothetical protein
VLFAGGSLYPRVTDESVGEPTNTAVLYDPADGTFQTGSMSASREYQTATFLPKDGSVLIAGGEDTEGTLTSAELFKP